VLGNGDLGQLDVPRNLGEIYSITAGGAHTCISASSGIRCWGITEPGNPIYPGEFKIFKRVDMKFLCFIFLFFALPVLADSDIVGVSAGSEHTCVLKKTGLFVGEPQCTGKAIQFMD